MSDLQVRGKRPVNVMLDGALVEAARVYSPNLSFTVSHLLTEFVHRERAKALAVKQSADRAADQWNAFAASYGSMADEYSPL